MCSPGLVVPEQTWELVYGDGGVGQVARFPGIKKLPYPPSFRVPLALTAEKSCAAAALVISPSPTRTAAHNNVCFIPFIGCSPYFSRNGFAHLHPHCRVGLQARPKIC